MQDEATSRAEQIRTAARYANILGPIPASFSVTVRQLVADELAGNQILSDQCEFQVSRLLRGPSALAVLYFASRTFCCNQMRPGWLHTPLQLARMYKPSALAAIISFTYLYKRLGRIVHPDEWQFISEPFQRQLETAGLLGATFPEVGMTAALIGGGMPYVALGTFLAHDRKGQGEYRRYLKLNRKFLDPGYEISRWGCTTVQVASAILVSAGFGVDETHRFDEGNTREHAEHGPANSYVTVRRWMNEMAAHPSTTSAVFSRSETAAMAPELRATLATVAKHGSKFRWLERNAADITPENTPDLLPDPSDALTRAQRKGQQKEATPEEEQAATPSAPE